MDQPFTWKPERTPIGGASMFSLLPVALATTLLSLGAARGDAQRLAPAYLHGPPEARHLAQADKAPVGEGTLAFAGVTGGVLGFVAGGYVAIALDSNCRELECLVVHFSGGVVGASALLPLGVHLANHRRGNYAGELAVSLAIGLAGLGLADATDSGWPLLGIPIAQLITTIPLECHADRANR